MGRFYCGDIEGKFWVGVQSSTDINNLINIKYKTNYTWKVCGCSVEDENLTYCNDCYENREAHKNDVLEEEGYDSDDTIELDYEDNCIDYLIEKNKHSVELLESMDKLKTEINKEILKEIDNIPQNEDILNAFSGIFNKVVETLDSIHLNDKERKKQEMLTCRYLLGYQIQYYLKNNDTCYVSCEC
tara:strand:- start:110 stop:667 length:558 start_codon:yes stop_codon:yes gene_type:complete